MPRTKLRVLDFDIYDIADAKANAGAKGNADGGIDAQHGASMDRNGDDH